MKKKATRCTIVALVSLMGVFAVACNFSKDDGATSGTAQTPASAPSEVSIVAPLETIVKPVVSPLDASPTQTHEPSGSPETPTPSETPEAPGNGATTEAPVESLPETPQTIENMIVLSDDAVMFAGVDGEFSTIKDYYAGGLPFGTYYVTLIKEKTSTLSFSEKFIEIDDAKFEFDSVFYDPVALFFADLDVSDDFCEVLICEYGVNDWIVNTFYRYDGSSIVELCNFIGVAFFDSHGKLIATNSVGGNLPGIIANPVITRSYYELRNGKLEEAPVIIKGMTYTFADDYASFGFYETPDAPTEKFTHELIARSPNFDSVNIGSETYERDFAGKRFTILDHSERETWYRGAWYYVQLEDGRKGIIHWWYAM